MNNSMDPFKFNQMITTSFLFGRQAPIGDDNYLHLAAGAGFDGSLAKRAFESDSPGRHHTDLELRYDEDTSSKRGEDSRRKCLGSDSMNRPRYENEHNLLRQYEANTAETIRGIENDLKHFDSCNMMMMKHVGALRSDKLVERNGNENFDTHRRLQDTSSLLRNEGINLSGSLSRKLSNYDNTRKLDEGTLTRRIRDDASDISSNSMSGRGNH